MYNFRKIKKKKKTKPAPIQKLTPQQTLFQISNCKQEQTDSFQSHLFLKRFSQIFRNAQKQRYKSAPNNGSQMIENFVGKKSIIRLNFDTKTKLKASQMKEKQNTGNQTKRKDFIKLIYLKKQKTYHFENQNKTQQTVRSKTVFSMDNSRSNFNTFQIDGNSQKCLNFKDPTCLKTMRKVAPIIVKNIKLQNRFRPIYLQ